MKSLCIWREPTDASRAFLQQQETTGQVDQSEQKVAFKVPRKLRYVSDRQTDTTFVSTVKR